MPAAYILLGDLRYVGVPADRASLVRLRTPLKNTIAASISKTGVQPRQDGLWRHGPSVLGHDLRATQLSARAGWVPPIAEHVTTEIRQVSTVITQHAEATPRAQLLQTMPGIGAYSALLIMSKIGDEHRLSDNRHLCSYAGLVHAVHASG